MLSIVGEENFRVWSSRRCPVCVAEICDALLLLPTFSFLWQRAATVLHCRRNQRFEQSHFQSQRNVFVLFFYTGFNLSNTLLALPILIWQSLSQLMLLVTMDRQTGRADEVQNLPWVPWRCCHRRCTGPRRPSARSGTASTRTWQQITDEQLQEITNTPRAAMHQLSTRETPARMTN